MNGIEKLTQKINADAQGEIDKILADAREQAAEITRRYEEQAKKEAADLLAQGEKQAAERQDRLASMAGMESRKELLAAKQEMVAKAFDLALEKLCALSDDEYAAMLAGLAAGAATTGKEQLIFSQKDRARVGKAVVTAANEKLGAKGNLTLSEQTRPMSGGFILSSGTVEVNCAFETLMRLQRSEIAGEVANVLFA